MTDFDKGYQNLLKELEIIQEENLKIFENGPRRLVRQVCMGKDEKLVIRFYHVCDITTQRSLDIGETTFRVGICRVPFVLRNWSDLPGFIEQVQEVSESIDEPPASTFRDEIYAFIQGLVTKVAQEHQKIHDMLLDVDETPEPVSAELFHTEKVYKALEGAKRAGIKLVFSVGDEERSAPAYSESQMQEKTCHVCGCLIPCRPDDEIPPRYHPSVPSYSPEPHWKRGRTGYSPSSSEPDQKRSRTGY
jgi:hypothetical protein